MSRVFVATELELDRQVVVKVLPPDLAAGINTDRFRREIQLAARLQHPHIVPLLAAGARGSLLYYTMPFITGENLRTRLTRSRELPVQEATRILREVADALEYAHAQGVVHRDIKPENILISGNHALVTDFGVSKALSSATSETPTSGPTLTSLGIALGTPAYMAPEQAAADPMVDARADIYALGVVAYELIAGRTPFAGLNQQQTLSAHITTAPSPVSEHRPQVPPGLAAVIMRCLEKHPSDRWQSAEQLHDALEPYALTSGATAPSQAVPAKPFRWTPQRVAVAAGIAGIIVTGLIVSTFAFKGGSAPLATGSTRQVSNAAGLEVHPSLSPDGKMIAYVAGPWNKAQLFVRQLSGGRAIALTDTTEVAIQPRWSPDGSQIIYSTFNGARIVPALGGMSTALQISNLTVDCTWSNAGDRLACVNLDRGSLVIGGARGENLREVPGTAGADLAGTPAWSPDDRLIAFTRGSQAFLVGESIGNIAPSSIWIVRSEGGSPVRVTDATNLNTSPVWTPDGALLFVSSRLGNRDVYMLRLDRNFEPRGEPARLTTGLNAHSISLDRTGTTLAYSVFTMNGNIWSAPISSELATSADIRPVTSGNQTIEQAEVSPDGQWIAYDSNAGGNQDVYRMPVGGGEPQQLTENRADQFAPSWSPDSREIAYHTFEKGNRDIHVMSASGGDPQVAVETAREELSPVWTPDGNGLWYFVFPDSMFEVRRNGKNGRWGTPRFRLKAFTWWFSPDGKRVAVSAGASAICPTCAPGGFVSDPDLGNKRPIPLSPRFTSAIAAPGYFAWSRDSRHLYFSMREKDGTSSIWQLGIDGDPERRVLHLTDPARQFFRTSLNADASRFYFTIGDRQSDVWTMELKKR